MTDDIPPVPPHGFATPAEVAELRATIAGLRALVDACAPYLKEGETPAERIVREIKDAIMLMGMLANDRKERDAGRATIAGLRDKLEIERALTDGAHRRARNAETALRAAPVAMRERAIAVVDVAWRETDSPNAKFVCHKIAEAIRALPLDAPAPVDPVAEAARVLLADLLNREESDVFEVAQDAVDAGEDGPGVLFAALHSLAQENRHD